MKKAVSYMGEYAKPDTSAPPFRNPVGRWNWFIENGVIADFYLKNGDYNNCMKYVSIPYKVALDTDSSFSQTIYNYAVCILAQAKIMNDQLDSAKYYIDLFLQNKRVQQSAESRAFCLQIRALYYLKKGELDNAEADLQQSWQLINANKLQAIAGFGNIAPDYYLALVRIKQNRLKEAISLLIKDIDRLKNERRAVLRDYRLLAALNEKTGNYEKAEEYAQSYISLQDSLLADQEQYRSLSFETEQAMSEKELAITKLQNENEISSLTKNFSLGIIALVLILAGVLYFRFRSKQKDNKVLEKTLSNLKSTQSQLIQSEKMASLGELTAGIAHEIQNPLNFVNNFSEVSNELIDEMNEELSKGDIEEAKAISSDIKQNLEKINRHGKRADAIVKGMLQHSRSSSGIKEATDINALCEEYLRLSYHGLRAKDNSFNATVKTDFDESIGNINIIPQDIGRVVLNLINNAFYVVDEKKTLRQAQGDSYEPTVSVATKKVSDKVLISVADNGNGIPQKVLDKIFQPFFTTKPTGQGTGLGLSLSYDIVKAH
ncbi:MAG: hypothetical protein JJE22_14835, partial [Bacteroidia bacterium]|nr:hypothetical protein [Bacteroidia bacterium]